jgi:Mg-chelatase subunit ChlD
MSLGINANDIKRALSGGGDISPFLPALQQALENAPISSAASFEVPMVLPETTTLLTHTDKTLTSLVDAWLEGKGYVGPMAQEIDLTLVGLAPYGRNISSYLERIIDETEPNIIVIDTSPIRLGTNMLYAFSIPATVGLPVYGEITFKDNQQFYANETFYNGNMVQTSITKSWLEKVPLIPVGMPSKPGRFQRRTVDEGSLDKEMQNSNLLTAYTIFDESLEKITRLQEETKIIPQIYQICSKVSNMLRSGITEKFVDEACYIASRILDVAYFSHSLGRKAKLLAIIDIKHYENTEHAINLLTKGITEETYALPKGDVPANKLTMIARYSTKLNEQAKQYSPQTTTSQELFDKEVNQLSMVIGNEQLPQSEVNNLITNIVGRIREHPEISRSVSVRGSIAFKEVLQGDSEIHHELTRSILEKAGLVTLPPRTITKQGDGESAVAIISDIVKEVLYGITFSKVIPEALPLDQVGQISPEDIMSSLQNYGQIPPEHQQHQLQEGRVVIVPDSYQDPTGDLTSPNSLRDGKEKQYSLTKNSIERLMEELEQKLKHGEITKGDYLREKARLEEMLAATSYMQSQMSGKELAETVMELMDARDKQWQKELNFRDMYVYYHIKGSCEGKQLSPPKRGWYGLKILLDDMEKRGIIKATIGSDFTLTARGMDTLLERLIPKTRKGKELKGIIDDGLAQVTERRHDIRRYTTGDVFRDISVRHTLREIAKQQKSLSDINRRDFRVYMKQHRRLQSDIVLCVDCSGSMGFHQKLIYARLVAAGLASSVLDKGGRVGIVTFNDFINSVMPLTNKKDQIFNYIALIKAGGNTNIGDGIKYATSLLANEPGRDHKYTVLITDGQPTAITEKAFTQLKPTNEKDLSEEYAFLETRRASSRGVKTSIVHITNGKESGEGLIKKIAGIGNGQVTRISCLHDLRAIMR